MIVEALIGGAQILTPFAAGLLASSLYGLKKLYNLPLAAERVEPVLTEPPVQKPPIALPERPARRTYIQKRIAPPAEAVEILIEFMQAQGATGFYTAKEIDDHWAWCVEEMDLCPLPATAVREAMRRYRTGQTRLSDAKYASVRLRNPKSVRPVLYKIPKVQPKSGALPDSPAASRESPGQSGPMPDIKPLASQLKSRRIAA